MESGFSRVPGPAQLSCMLTLRHWTHMNAKIIYGTAWHAIFIHHFSRKLMVYVVCRKKERTTALVVSAVLAGFRAIDTG